MLKSIHGPLEMALNQPNWASAHCNNTVPSQLALWSLVNCSLKNELATADKNDQEVKHGSEFSALSLNSFLCSSS